MLRVTKENGKKRLIIGRIHKTIIVEESWVEGGVAAQTLKLWSTNLNMIIMSANQREINPTPNQPHQVYCD